MTFHETILDQLLKYREKNPEFNFLVRQRTGAGKRFESGHWFQGNDNYAFAGLIDASGGINKTRSVGLLFRPIEEGFECGLQVRFPGEIRSELLKCYKKLVQELEGFVEKDSERFDKNLGVISNDFGKLFSFLDQNYTKIVSIFKDVGCKDVLVSDEKFNNLIINIDKQRGYLKTKKYWLYAPGENAIEWDAFHDQGIMALGWDNLGDLTKYKSKDEIVKALQNLFNTDSSKKNDASANYDFVSGMNIGDVVFVKKGTSKLLGYGIVESDYSFDSTRNKYKHVRKVDWKRKGLWEAGHNLAIKTLTNISNYLSPDTNYSTYHERLMAIINGNQSSTIKTVHMDYPLNTILYGPPGTGKTFQLREKYFDMFTVSESSLSKEQFIVNIVADLTWWQTFAIALYDLGKTSVNQLLEHEIVKAKTSLSNAKNIKPIAWSRMQAHAVAECPNVNVVDRSEPSLFYKEADSEWRVVNEKVDSLYPEGIELLEQIKNFKLNENKAIKNFEFVTFHQSFGYEDFVEGIKPKLEEGNSTLEYEIKDGIFKKLCQRALQDPQNKYAIFIDEINRGNVSAIFGELITLIEDDKRIGSPQELKLKLPYSKTEFGVPSNLYIIGTMNTADRSIEALDTALRRRFEFKEMMPNYEVIITEEVGGINLSEILETINKRIELLVDRDHTIGHSYFIGVNTEEKLANAFNNKIVPLLQEYFYGDYGKIGLVLGKGFVEKVKNDSIEFANFKYDNANDFKTATFKLLKVTSESIMIAIKALLAKKDEASL